MPKMPPAPRVTARKKYGFRLGQKTTTVEVGPNKQLYTTHEDLLCKTSAYFRNLLRPHGRPIEGKCSICHQDLSLLVEVPTQCNASCGGNFHYTCIEDWKQRAAPQTAACPLCRQANGESLRKPHRIANINEQSFEMYAGWLYTGRILVAPTSAFETMSPTLAITHAYELGVRLNDGAFSYALMQSLIEVVIEDGCCSSSEALSRVYVSGPWSSPLKKLLVGICINYLTTHNDRFFEVWNHSPAGFRRDLALALLRRPDAEVETWTVEGLSRYLPERPTMQPEHI